MTMNSQETAPITLTLPNDQWTWIDQMSTKYQLGASSSSGLMGSHARSISASACINSVMVGDVAMPSTVHHTDPNAASAKVLDLPISQTAYLRSASASPLMNASAMATQILQACMKASDEWLVFGATKNQLGLENRNKLPQEDYPGESKMLACRGNNNNKVQPRDCGEQEVVVMGDGNIMYTNNIVSKSSSTNDRKEKGTSTSPYTKVPLSLTKQQWEWLENMTTKHKLSSMDKAIRCCVNCVALEGVNVNHSNSQQEIDSSSINVNNRGEEHIQQGIIKQVGLSNEQLSWLDAKFQQNNGQEGVARRFIQSCMEMEEQKVFGIIRCKSSVAKCEGAQKSIETIAKQYYGQKKEEVVVKENIDVSSSEKCGCDHVVGEGNYNKNADDDLASNAKGEKKKNTYRQISVVLKQDQWDWLDEMAVKHKLSSVAKAVRCCINCVALSDANTTGASLKYDTDSSIKNGGGVEKQVELSDEQIVWVESKLSNTVQEDDLIAFLSKQVIGICMALEEYTVFGIIRCKKSIAQCEGAQAAVQNIGDHFHQKNNEVAVEENIDISLGPNASCGCSSKKK